MSLNPCGGAIILSSGCLRLLVHINSDDIYVKDYMACFDPEELVDFVRHQCIINADDDSRCKKILQSPSRKAKPGGLPLNFRSVADSDTSSGEHSPRYSATADFESTYGFIQERLNSRFEKNDFLDLDDENKAVMSNAVDALPCTSDLEFFQCTDVSYVPSPISVETLLEKTDFLIRSDLASYARFAAPDIENGRKLLVFYSFAKLESSSCKCFSLTIYAQCEICVSDLIGLCCYEYARCRKTNNIGSVTHYHLLMAEENGEVDRDLPPIDGHRLLNELGSCWSTIALEKHQGLDRSEMINVTVYTVSGKRYEFLMDSLNVSLRWLRDQAVKKRVEDEGPEFLSDCPTQFLLLRINSSRGSFALSRCSSFAQECGSTSKIHGDLQGSSTDVKDQLDNSIVCYLVEKIHRYKPKRSALLTIRHDGFELEPSCLDRIRKRNNIFLNPSLKTLYVTWDYVGGAEITDRSNSKRGVRIVWLAYRTIKHKSKALQMSELTKSMQYTTLSFESDRSIKNVELSDMKLYNDAYWKILELETDVDDAWNITEKITAITDKINSVVRQIYNCSSGGSKKPKKAAAKAFDPNSLIMYVTTNLTSVMKMCEEGIVYI
ncbi:unnamed protein product [Litomosoides sigmodontis]|uniref:Uncharacterized protein n=1 Tax=Litomosoides sigmodontis TaxID=42156 RepID=A0A3P6T0N0_LITSI|nr:unnamed protein product [Litomosoides sigmodontis]